jgi:hypothetical protein
MPSRILFVFEGPKAENLIVDSLTRFFLNENNIVTCAYCNTIYKLFKEISKDEDLDTFALLKNIEANKQILKDFKRSDFAEVYMFFDYDGHATNASDTKLKKLLTFFNEETEMGKLFISYPMVEALKHIEDFATFNKLKVAIADFEAYKKLANKNCLNSLKHIGLYDFETWKKLSDAHLRKMQFVVSKVGNFPSSIVSQLLIFEKQIEYYIKADKTVSVLSAFPVFLLDYYGCEDIKRRIA